MSTHGTDRSWWTPAQRQRLRHFDEEFSSKVVRTVGWSNLSHALQDQFPGVTDALLESWRRSGAWDPRVLYRACEIVDHDPWAAARAIGALPHDATDMDRALQASTVLAIERYYEAKDELRGSQADELRGRLTKALPEYEVHTVVMHRGRDERRPYHTCLAFQPHEVPQDDPLFDLERSARREALRRAVDRVLQGLPVCAHWEMSRECKPERHRDHEVLIVEDAFDNRAPLSSPRALQQWAALTPIVVLGVHYSGAKDVGVELARRLDLGSLDLGRYMGEVFGERLPFRRETNLQGQLFENVTSSLLGRKLIITVDDYQALERLEVRRPDRFRGTAVLLRLDRRLLEYGAYRIWKSTERDERPAHPDMRSLEDAQAALERLSRRFEHTVPTVPVTCDAIVRAPDGSFPDQVDDMFDTYMRAARTIEARLEERRDALQGRRPWGRRWR